MKKYAPITQAAITGKVRLTMSIPVWNSTIPARLRRYDVLTSSLTGNADQRNWTSSSVIVSARISA